MAKVKINKGLDNIFEGTMTFNDVKDMINKIGKLETNIKVSKGTVHMTCTQNIHHTHIYKNGISYDIHLTEKQFKKMLPLFKEMGEIEINEYFWLN